MSDELQKIAHSLGGIESDISSIKEQLNGGRRSRDAHEERIRAVEKKQWIFAGGITAAATLLKPILVKMGIF